MVMKHIVSLFDEELEYLEDKILFMGEFAVEMINQSVEAMLNKDTELAKEVMKKDLVLDNTEREIDDKATTIIAKRQPVAVDLREIIGTIRIASDLERIGDKGKNIAKRSITIVKTPQIAEFNASLANFAKVSLNQLQKAMEAYKERSLEKIQDVITCDKETNSMYDAMFRSLLTYMMENPRNITACTHLLFCAKNLERVGDHATNIVESLHYMITGEYLPFEDCQYIENFTKESI